MFVLIEAISIRIIFNGPIKKGHIGILSLLADIALTYAVLDHYWGLGWFK